MTHYLFSFEKLNVWKEAKLIAKEVHIITRGFPAEEKFGIVQQMRRAANSVCSNIAEGSTRQSGKDQAHFSTIAYGSLIELLNHLLLAYEFGFINDDTIQKMRELIGSLSVRLNNLRKTQLKKGLNNS